MVSISTLGVALWLVYGLVIGTWPIVIANAVTLALATFILVMKLRSTAKMQTAPEGAVDVR